MPNEEILKYIKDCLSKNYSKEQIKQSLIQAGWGNSQVDEALLATQNIVASLPPLQPKEINPVIHSYIPEKKVSIAKEFAEAKPAVSPKSILPMAIIAGTAVVIVGIGITLWILTKDSTTPSQLATEQTVPVKATTTEEISPGVQQGGIKATSDVPLIKQSISPSKNITNKINETTANWKIYRNELWGLSFKYPKDWGDPYNPQGDRLTLERGDRLSIGIPADYSAVSSFVEKYHFEEILIEARLDQGSTLDDYVKQLGLIETKILTVGGAQAIQGKQITHLPPGLGSESIDTFFTYVKHGSFVYQFRNKPSEVFLVSGATSESAQDIHNKILNTVEFF